MKWFLFLAALALTAPAAPACAQDTDQASIAEQQQAMKRLSWMHGVWRGPGGGFNRSGPYKVTQTERIGPMLGGTLIVIEGKGYMADGSVGFNAFGIISYDPRTKRYTIHSYALGHAGDFPLTPTDNGYIWEVQAGPDAVIRYTATLKDGTWTEVGDYVAGGQPPRRIFEMNLKRVGNSDWPLAGGIPKD
ncbi:DUF1579 domain-containing protein [Sphingomonas sp. LB-2]|uniref:DUF1579 domain-containing protein n=1 Tax=Sphingomonas caeni TaxID=2984949 RepID=UPI002231C799|nr:DUF1579 domain-containing protein [Sphingomonas caeni]MCW3847299.1 DUF1579 domain-containing protein [Sphingomonas caeni]